jgi:hypothetical protein
VLPDLFFEIIVDLLSLADDEIFMKYSLPILSNILLIPV